MKPGRKAVDRDARDAQVPRLQDSASAPERMAEECSEDRGPLQVASWCSQPPTAHIRGRVGWLAEQPQFSRTVGSRENRWPPLGMLKT
jgi:hypothetical protein